MVLIVLVLLLRRLARAGGGWILAVSSGLGTPGCHRVCHEARVIMRSCWCSLARLVVRGEHIVWIDGVTAGVIAVWTLGVDAGASSLAEED